MNDRSAMQLRVADQYRQIGRLREAEATYLAVLRADPDHLTAHESLGRLYVEQRDEEAARRHWQRALELHPDNPRLLIRLADLQQNAGDFDAACKGFRRAAGLLPEAAPQCYFQISQITRFSGDEPDIAAMQALHDRVADNAEARMYLSFALGKVHDDLNEYRVAFRYFAAANEIAARRYPYSHPAIESAHADLIRAFDRDFVSRAEPCALHDPKPIFITGLPRSGTTLVEQILAGHSQVFGGGELRSLHDHVRAAVSASGEPGTAAFRAAEAEHLPRIARAYIDDLAALADGEARVTDKSVGSVIYVGLIQAILPEAKIVFCQRDLRDLGWSCYQKYFGDQQSFSYDLRSIARYSIAREQLMAHWTAMFPGSIYTVRYETLVADFAEQTRGLLEFCELPFESACLNFQATPRRVNTLSLQQVRQPVNAASVGRWKNYAAELEPLLDTLETAAGTGR